VSSNDGSCDTGMVGWPTSSMNSLRVCSNEDCLGEYSYDEGMEKGLSDCGYSKWCSSSDLGSIIFHNMSLSRKIKKVALVWVIKI
jgi:hypothetical protein